MADKIALLCKMTALSLIVVSLSSCQNFLRAYLGPNSLIATSSDSSFLKRKILKRGQAAIAYDPDGCQVWIIDDGLTGYSGRRFNPDTGLPVCNTDYPPGTVLGNYQTNGRDNSRDLVPGRVIRPK